MYVMTKVIRYLELSAKDDIAGFQKFIQEEIGTDQPIIKDSTEIKKELAQLLLKGE
jgi:hypothetical protein